MGWSARGRGTVRALSSYFPTSPLQNLEQTFYFLEKTQCLIRCSQKLQTIALASAKTQCPHLTPIPSLSLQQYLSLQAKGVCVCVCVCVCV